MGKRKAQLRVQKAQAKRWSPYNSKSRGTQYNIYKCMMNNDHENTCTDTSTSSNDSGIISSRSSSPGQSLTPERFSSSERSPVPQPDCSELSCQPTNGPMPSHESLWNMIVDVSPEIGHDNLLTPVGPEETHSGSEQTADNSSPGSSLISTGSEETPHPEETSQLQLTSTPGSSETLSPESLRQKAIEACPNIDCDKSIFCFI